MGDTTGAGTEMRAGAAAGERSAAAGAVRLGTGIGWRPEIADTVERMPDVDWVEVVAENVCPGHLPDSLLRLRERGVTVVPHGVGLGLGGADRPDPGRLAELAARAQALGAPLVTEHIAFVRAGGPYAPSERLEAGHLLPVPRTRDGLDVLCENVRIAQDALPVPLAVENIAALFTWPDEELTEGQFLSELVERTGVRLLIDVANLHTNHVNSGEDPARALAELPLEALAYVHVAGGYERDGVWHDSHAHPVPPQVLDVLADLASRVRPPGVLLERDENFPAPAELEGELRAIRETVAAAEPAAPRPAAPRASAAPARRLHGEAAPDGATAPDSSAASDRAAALDGAAPSDGSAPSGGTAVSGNSAVSGGTEAARQRLGLAQAALLSSLVAGTPVPDGFDRVRLGVQRRALARKRADVVAKVAPELPRILGDGYRPAFLSYAAARPLTGGYRQDALEFARYLLRSGRAHDGAVRRALNVWCLERSGRKPPSPRPVARLVRAARAALQSA